MERQLDRGGGGVAEMLRSLIAYVRGVGIDARWVVIEGDADFFHLTKRLHHALHGSRRRRHPARRPGARDLRRGIQRKRRRVRCGVRPRDVVLILHDPQRRDSPPI